MIITKGYKPEDVPTLFEINDLCYSGVERPSATQFRGMLGHDVFVCKIDHDLVSGIEGIVGFAICRQDVHPSYLWSIAVHPQFQNRGVGGNLLREVIKYYSLRYERKIGLHCKPTNPAQKLYFDYGFRVKSVEKNWYLTEDALYMERELCQLT